jgi:hypothetical protein
MKTQIEETKFVKEIIEKDINFPFFGWWSNKKEEIIKIYYESSDYTPDIPKHLKCIIIKNGWNINPSITSKTISVSNDGIINGDIIPLLKDYANIATEQEFNEFKQTTFEALL